MQLIKPYAMAYYNHGRWIADCPENCGFAILLQSRQGMFHCNECQVMWPVEWPSDVDEITEVLEVRKKKHRNWFPHGHDLAVRFNLPHGQTVNELREETEDHNGVD